MQHKKRLTAALFALAVLGAIVGSVFPAGASNDLSNGAHHYRVGTYAVGITLRNQIGPGPEGGHIHTALARWGSTDASNYYPSGPARSDYSFAYAYGGPPSCSSAGASNDITFCVVANSGVHDEGLMHFHYGFNSNDHMTHSYIHINVAGRDDPIPYCHEFGHALGLTHRNSTCLHPGWASQWASEYPGQHNLDTSEDVNAHGHPL